MLATLRSSLLQHVVSDKLESHQVLLKVPVAPQCECASSQTNLFQLLTAQYAEMLKAKKQGEFMSLCDLIYKLQFEIEKSNHLIYSFV